jgi:hypothetical protein
MIERQLTDFGAHRSLRKLGNGIFCVFDAIAVVCEYNCMKPYGRCSTAYLALYASKTLVYRMPSSSNVTLSAVMAD